MTRRIALEDGARLELSLPNGRLHAHATTTGPHLGDTVRVSIDGGVAYRAGSPAGR